MQTASVSITVKIGDSLEKTFTVSGETDGSPYRLARRLSQTVSGDAQVWAVDQAIDERSPEVTK